MQTYEFVQDALGDGTRRQVLHLLRDGPKSVGEVAAALPVSRPAVSQHLKVLKRAGLVVDQAAGNRRLYRVHPAGLEAVRTYIEGFWDDVLTAFAQYDAQERSSP